MILVKNDQKNEQKNQQYEEKLNLIRGPMYRDMVHVMLRHWFMSYLILGPSLANDMPRQRSTTWVVSSDLLRTGLFWTDFGGSVIGVECRATFWRAVGSWYALFEVGGILRGMRLGWAYQHGCEGHLLAKWYTVRAMLISTRFGCPSRIQN